MRWQLTIVVCILMTGLADAQPYHYVLEQRVTVQRPDGSPLALAWAGGINSPQFNSMDIDGDGTDDLVLFDRMANKVLTFVNEDGHYQYRPEYENLFPSDVTNWLLLRDYNGDGKKDIFTGHILGIKVYTNITPAGERLRWNHFIFYTGASGSSPVVMTQAITVTNLQLQYDDLPAITDADGDGDLDIFAMRYQGNGVEFHQNFSVENGWGSDSLSFKRVNQRWGNFTECECGVIALNGEECPPHGGRTKHAGGKALLAMDANGDGTVDLIFSEAGCEEMFLLPNTGTLQDPEINSYAPFPATYPVNLSSFPAAFYEDVDFDGVKDVLAVPNLYTKASLSDNLEQSAWLFKNLGTNEQPKLTFVQNNFLQDGMIDVGDNSVPAFTDADGDGDQDMFISRNNVVTGFGIASSIHFYENIGSSGVPMFRLITDDFMLFSQSQYFNMKIQFADVNRDRVPDLVWTASRFGDGFTRLYYVINKGQKSLNFDGQAPIEVDFSMTSAENLCLFDVDGDTWIDILAGRTNGAIQYWRNTGSPGDPQFELEDPEFLGIGSDGFRQSPACLISDLNADGRPDFGFEYRSGELAIIDDFEHGSQDDAITDIISDPMTSTFRAFNLGGRLRPVAVNLFESSKPSIVVGNVLGGLRLLRNENEFVMFPNPVGEDVVNLQVETTTIVEIYSSSGSRLGRALLEPGQQPETFLLPPLAAGLYILRFISAERSFTKKMVIR